MVVSLALNTTFNAWVSGTMGCLGAPLNASSTPAPAGSTAYLELGLVPPAPAARFRR